jgi:hypothetical protein
VSCSRSSEEQEGEVQLFCRMGALERMGSENSLEMLLAWRERSPVI